MNNIYLISLQLKMASAHGRRKSWYSYLLYSAILLTNAVAVNGLFGQNFNATWPLTSHAVPTTTGIINAGNHVFGPGISSTSYTSNNGANANSGWSEGTSRVSIDYYEFTMSPGECNNLTLTGISFEHDRNDDGPRSAAVYYSLDNFGSETQIGSNFSVSQNHSVWSNMSLGISVLNGETLTVRIFAWNADDESPRRFSIRNMMIEGTTSVLAGGFSGYFGPQNWQLTNTNANGSVNTTFAPCSITLTGGDNQSGNPGSTEYAICVGEGIVAFDWNFTAPVASAPEWHTGSGNQSSNTGNGGSSFTVARPANVVAGDLVIVLFHTRANVNVNWGSPGFNLIRTETSGGAGSSGRGFVASYWRIAGANEPANYIFPVSNMGGGGDNGNTWIAVVGRVTGHNPVSPIDAHSGTNSGTSDVTSLNIPALTSSGPNRLLVAAIAIEDNNTSTHPTGMTEIYDHTSTTGADAAGSGAIQVVGQGSTGTRTFSWSGTDAAAGLMFAINPAEISEDDDIAYYFINGDTTHIASSSGSGSLNVPVMAGDNFGFGVRTASNTQGPGVLTISNFSAPEYLVNCDIDGPVTSCGHEQGLEFSSPFNPEYIYVWAIVSGDAVIVGPIDQNSIVVNAGNNDFVIELMIFSGTCEVATTCYFPVDVLPDCSISGPLLFCEDQEDIQFSGPDGMITYSWQVFGGNATIDGPSDQQAVSVDGGNQSFLIQLTITDNNGCSTTCERILNLGRVSCTSNVLPLAGATGLVPTNFNLSWNPSLFASGYLLYFGTNNPPTNIIDGLDLGTVLTYNVGDLSSEEEYFWRIVPYDACGPSPDECPVWTFTTWPEACEQAINLTYCTTCNPCSYSIIANPLLTGSCGNLKIALVLDESQSIANIGATQQVWDGVLAFVNTLACTEVQLAVIEFRGNARFVLDEYQVVDANIADAMEDYFEGNPNPNLVNNATYTPGQSGAGGTNYQAGLLAVDALPETPDLVIFFTDGDPTHYFNNSNPAYGQTGNIDDNCNNSNGPHISNPSRIANKLKCEGAHIFAYGVSGATLGPLQAISGTVAYVNGVNSIANSDYVIGNFAGIAQGLSNFVEQLCPFNTDIVSQDICEGGNEGKIAVYVPIELHPFSYTLFIGDESEPLSSGSGISDFPALLEGLSAGPYRIELQITLSGSGCTRTETLRDTIETNAGFVAATIDEIVEPTCDEWESGSATLLITEGEAHFTIILKKDNMQIGDPIVQSEEMYVATGLDFGSYSFEVQDKNKCNTATVLFELQEPQNCCPEACILIDGPPSAVCPGTLSDFGISIDDFDDCDNPVYAWTLVNPDNGATIPGATDESIVTVNAGLCGEYTIQVSVTCDGCEPLICEKTVIVEDNEEPSFTRPADITLYMDAACNYDADVSITGDVTNKTDNCFTGLDATYSDEVEEGACASSFVITRTWSLADGCGNEAAVQIQTITVMDNIAPTFSAPSDTIIYRDAGCAYDADPFVTGDVTDEADNCGTGEATYDDEMDSTDPCEIIITRTWSLTDDCGNTAADQVQVITIRDNTPPTFTVPDGIVLYRDGNCNYDASILVTGDVMYESDNCGTGEATFEDDVDDTDPCEVTITRTWSLVDDCGNPADDQIQQITIFDNAAPTFTRPADITITMNDGCTYDADPTATGDVTNEADNCSTGLQADYNDSPPVAGPCSGSYVITRTWSLVDDCGNPAEDQVQTITIIDITAPVIVECPDALNLEGCGTDAITGPVYSTTPTASTIDVFQDPTNNGSATDNCGIASVTYVDVAAGTCPIVVTRTWTISDACGNSSTCNQTINIYDTTAPVFDLCPFNRELFGCGTGVITDPVYSTNATATTIAVFEGTANLGSVMDNCDIATVTYMDVAAGTCPIVVTRTWTITDACGNFSTCNQTITVTDNTAPFIDLCPIDRHLTGCSPSVITEPDYSTTTTNTTLDVFGNTINFGLVFEDCEIISITYIDVATVGVCPIIVTRTWTITDACGNSDTCLQPITITDNTAPVIDLCPIPRDLYGCSPLVITDPDYSTTTTVTDLSVFSSTTNFGLAIDDCSLGAVTYIDVASGSCPILVTRTWTVFDSCGNADSCSQLIMVHDTTSPVIVCPADITILSSDSPLPANTGTASATDDCDDSPSVSYTDEIVSVELIIRTWTASDDCGNMTSCDQEITIESLGTICGSVFDDLGQPMSGVEIRLMADLNFNETVDGGDTLVAVEFSNVSGEFCFTQILAGNYVLLEIQPLFYGSLSDYDTSTDPINDPDGDDSADGPDDEIPVTLEPGEDDLDNDFVNIICPIDLPVIPNDTICENGGVVFEIDDLNLGTLTYDWDFGSGSNPPMASGLGPHPVIYSGTSENQSTGAIIELTISKDGCTDLTGPISLVKVNTYPDATIDGSTASGCYYTNRIFEPVAPEIPGATYQWNFGAAAVPPSATGYGPHSVYYTTTGIKTVKLVIHPNEEGVQCSDSTTLSFNITFCPGFILGFVRTETGAPIGSVNIRLYADADTNGLPDSPTHIMSVNTNSGGSYNFPSITPGHYVIIQTQPTGWYSLDDYDDSDDGDVVPNIDSLDNLIPVTLLPSEVDSFNYFIETAIPGSITGAVFDDMDGDQLPDPGEGIPGVIISLYTDNNTNGLPDSDTPVDTAMTGSTGHYSFTNVPVGHYVIVETQPSGYVSIKDYDQSNDGDAVPNTNMNDDIIPVTLTNMELDAHNYFIEELVTVGIFCPQDVTIPCHADTSPANTGVATGTSNCSALTIMHSDVSSQDPNTESCGHFTYEITRTWVATDTCGVFNSCVQTISVQDVTAPVWTTPAESLDITLDCTDAAGLEAAQMLFPVAEDDCDSDVTNIVKIPGEFVEGSCPQAGTITNSWTVTDVCGNISLEFLQVITIIDTLPPIFLFSTSTQLDVTVECSDIEGLEEAQALQPLASDACAGLIIDLNEISGPFVEGPCPESGTYTNVFVFTDNCGNSGPPYTQVITVVDSSPPVWVTPNNLLDATLDCGDTDGLAAAQGWFPVAVDNCDPDVTDIEKTVGAFVPGLCSTSGSYTNTWTVTDNCGNISAVYTQVITLVDTMAPVIETETGFLDRTLDCSDGAGLDEALALVPTAMDECDPEPQIHLFSDDITPDENCPEAYVRVRVWNFTDDCSNTSQTFTQTIVVSDNAVPSFTKPADITIYSGASCDYDASLEVTGDVEGEADNCSLSLEANYEEDIQPGSCEGNFIITRTWSLVDDCGNAAADQIQIITVQDTIAPAFTRPPDITIYTDEACAYSAIPSITGEVVDATDNCSTVLEATYEDDLEEGECEGTWTIIRTWSLTDDCGNAAPVQFQTITILDNLAPTFTRPADIILYTDADCFYDASPEFAGDVTDISDNCAVGLTASFEDDVEEGSCEGSWTITRTWSLVDLCGNESDNQIQTITILDNTPPAFTRPADITIVTTDGCGFDPDPSVTGDVTDESDNCSTGLQATYEDVIDDGACNGLYVITRTWSLVDDCGNAAGNQVQSITIKECNLTVMNTNNDGPASLRQAIECAENGDTIRFHSSLAGLTITIHNGKLIIDKDLVLLSTLIPRVMVASEIDGLFDIKVGSVVEFRDLNILSGPVGTEGAAFKNEGILHLHNIHVYRNMDLPAGLYLIRNKPTSQLILSGNCFLQME